jgi:hypothetical protein
VLFACILELAVELARKMVISGAGDQHASGGADLLQASCYVDAVTEQIVAFDDHVAKIDADPMDNPALLWNSLLAHSQLLLNGSGASDRTHDGAELGDEAVAHQLDDPASVLSQKWVDYLLAQLPEGSQRGGLVLLDETRIADHVSGENGR